MISPLLQSYDLEDGLYFDHQSYEKLWLGVWGFLGLDFPVSLDPL